MEVEGEGAIEAAFVPMLNGPQLGSARVDEYSVEAAEGLADRLGGRVARIGRDHPPLAPECPACPIERFRIPAANLTGGFQADTGSASGDEGSLVLESIHVAEIVRKRRRIQRHGGQLPTRRAALPIRYVAYARRR